MSTNIKKCPVCLSDDSFKKLIEFGDIPISDQYLKSPEEKPDKISLFFEYCDNCVFIRQKESHNYNYKEDVRKTGHTLMSYCQDVVEYLKEANDGLVVDVGCNDGVFLDLLSRKGLKKLLGIEPSINFVDLCRSKGYEVENIYFNRKEAQRIRKKYGEASALVYRHVLEHVESPFDFLLAAKDLLKENGKLVIELPDSNNIINGLNTNELLDQHISYFTPKNLEFIVNRAGFKIENILVQPYMGTDAILLFASNDKVTNIKDYKFSPERCENFSYKWEMLSEKMREKIKVLEPPLIGLGASHPQSRFLIFSGIGEYIHRLIDDDSFKIGKYVCAPNPLKIISTEQFISSNLKGTLLHTAFGHDEWLKQIVQSSNKEYSIFRFSKKLNETKF